MGKKDIVQKLYTEDNRIFADIVNYMLYEGQSVIREQDLTEVNGEELFCKKPEQSKVILQNRDIEML